MNTLTYYEEIDALPSSEHNLVVSYVLGFLLSIVCTLGAYAVVTLHIFSFAYLIGIIFILAFVQFAVQIVYFLHLSFAPSARDKFVVFMFSMFIVVTLIGGSIWVMFDLNERMMPSVPLMQEYMHRQTGI